ncbi:MAG: hypothetical protein IKR98_01605 [Bacteroidaceae bacterium]|nr:hypothetical protein [Bacteroidaceae bacterium]
MIKTERIFTDYDFDGKKIPLIKSFAMALEWLYVEDNFEESEFDDGGMDYCMLGRLPLYDMINLVFPFITTACGDFGETKINEYIRALENNKNPFDTSSYFYKYEDNFLLVNNMPWYTTEVILWAAYIYCLFRAEYDKSVKFKRAKIVLLKIFARKVGLDLKDIDGHFLMKHKNKTITAFAKAMLKNKDDIPNDEHTEARPMTREKTKGHTSPSSDELSQLKSLNKELMERLGEKDTEIAELQASMAKIGTDLETMQKKVSADSLFDVTADEIVIELLTPLLAVKDSQAALSFLKEAIGKDDIGIVDLVMEQRKLFSPKTRKIDIWRILHAAKLYTATSRNFDTNLRNRGWQ